MPRLKTPGAKGAPVRDDGRRALLTYMDPVVIKSLKKAALDRETTAFLIIEQAVKLWLRTERDESSKSPARPKRKAEPVAAVGGEQQASSTADLPESGAASVRASSARGRERQ